VPEPKSISDQILIDLTRKCSADVGDRILQSALLVEQARDQMMIAVAGAGPAFALAAGFSTSVMPHLSPELRVDAMWGLVRPIALKAVGGDEGDFRRLLERCRGR
jgi:hypothetical protein